MLGDAGAGVKEEGACDRGKLTLWSGSTLRLPPRRHPDGAIIASVSKAR
jgi:hypothetical protein